MATTLGLSGIKPYILNHLVLPTNTEITAVVPVKQYDKEYIDGDAKLNIRLPFLSEPLLANEEYTRKIIDIIKTNGIVSVKTLINNMILSLDYILSDSMGNTVSSEIKISDIQLSNLVVLSTGKVGDILSYRDIKKITSRAVIDIKRDRNYGIKYSQTQLKNDPYTLVIQGLNVFSEILQIEGDFDDVVEEKYREKVFNFIKANYSSNETIYKQFIDKYFPNTSESQISYAEDYNRFWSCKDDYKYKTQYLLDKEILGKNGIDIINSDMLKILSPIPISFEIKNVDRIVVDLELYVEMGDISDLTELENAIIDNKALIDGISFIQPTLPSGTDIPGAAIETPIGDSTTDTSTSGDTTNNTDTVDSNSTSQIGDVVVPLNP